MEVKLPLNAQSQMDLARIKDNPFALKVGQIIDVKVIQIKQDTQTLTLELADKMLRVQSNQPLTLVGGDTLKLEVMRLNPSPEFKIVSQTPATTPPLPPSSPKQLQSESILLKVPAPSIENQSTGSKGLPLLQMAYASKAQLMAKVVAVSEHQVQLQLQTAQVDSKSGT